MPYALAAFLLHAATAWRYGYFRDELYFIACSKRLAFGYVDQPPLVALAAWLSAPFGYNLIALRLLPMIAAALTVWLAANLARELGGRSFAQFAAAAFAALLPAYLLLGNTLTTTSFEPLSWTLLIYAIVRLCNSGDERYWLLAAAAFTFGMYGKYSMLLFAVSVLLALLCTPQRTVLYSKWFAGSAALSLLLLLPNIVWQGAHGWPFVCVVIGDFEHRHAFQTGVSLEYTDFRQNALAFVTEQLVYSNPALACVWIGGALLTAFHVQYRRFRFLSLAFVFVLVFAIVLEAKGYYIIGVYAALLAAGAVAIERLVPQPAARALIVTPIFLLALVTLPLALPVLPVNRLIAYTRVLHLTGQDGTPPRLIQPVYAEEFGWDGLARSVAGVYDALPPIVRRRTAVFADTYGDAGALDFFGPRYGLPPAISSQNTYYLWGTRGYDGRTMIVVGATQIERIRRLYRHVRLVTTYGNAYKWVVEGPAPIYLCTEPIAPLPQIWPELRWYGA
ncbi:MAG TPA: glycosyltransferase family 39 protein [Candidatus Baltobacteraceae bacterium]|nr:glycosyltransferase family 39 protein [Candidatus Baltobacteraceae bacterium]